MASEKSEHEIDRDCDVFIENQESNLNLELKKSQTSVNDGLLKPQMAEKRERNPSK